MIYIIYYIIYVPIVNSLSLHGTYIIVSESTLTPNIQKYSLEFIVDVVHSVSLDKRIMTCIHPYRLIQNNFRKSSMFHLFILSYANSWQPLFLVLETEFRNALLSYIPNPFCCCCFQNTYHLPR